MRISDWSSDVCSSDLPARGASHAHASQTPFVHQRDHFLDRHVQQLRHLSGGEEARAGGRAVGHVPIMTGPPRMPLSARAAVDKHGRRSGDRSTIRSEEHTSELQSLMRISYAVFCLKKKTNYKHNIIN